MPWTTEDAAEHYRTTFSDDTLLSGAADLRQLAGKGVADVEVAIPALDAELKRRGLA